MNFRNWELFSGSPGIFGSLKKYIKGKNCNWLDNRVSVVISKDEYLLGHHLKNADLMKVTSVAV